MSIDSILSVEDGQEVSAGQVIAKIPKNHLKQKISQVDCLVSKLFETRKPKDPAIMCEIEVRYPLVDYKNKRRVI